MYHFCCWTGQTPPTQAETIKLPGGISLADATALVREIARHQQAETAAWYLGSVGCGPDEDGRPTPLYLVDLRLGSFA